MWDEISPSYLISKYGKPAILKLLDLKAVCYARDKELDANLGMSRNRCLYFSSTFKPGNQRFKQPKMKSKTVVVKSKKTENQVCRSTGKAGRNHSRNQKPMNLKLTSVLITRLWILITVIVQWTEWDFIHSGMKQSRWGMGKERRS